MPVGAAIGATLGGAAIGAYGSKEAAEDVQAGQDAATAEARRQFDVMLGIQQPAITARDDALSLLSMLFGFGGPSSTGGGMQTGGAGVGSSGVSPGGFTREDLFIREGGPQQPKFSTTPTATMPGGMGGGATQPLDITSLLLGMPGAQFQLGQGQLAVEGSAAAGGGLYSGAGMKALQERAIADSGDIFNDTVAQLLNIAGMGAPAANQAAQGAIQTGQIVGQGLQGSADARASGTLGTANTLGNSLNNIAWILGSQPQGAAPVGGVPMWGNAVMPPPIYGPPPT